MDRINKVLLATDFSAASQNALEHAALIAAKNDAQLHILHVQQLLHPVDINEADFPDGERLQQALDKAVAHHVQKIRPRFDVPVLRHVLHERRPEQAIVDFADEHQMDLIVIGSHGRSGLPRLFLGSVAERVVRLSPVSVLVVGADTAHAQSEGDYKSILVPVDFSDASLMALEQAKALATQHHARLVVMHAVESAVYPSVYLPAGGPLPLETYMQVEQRSKEALERLTAGLNVPCEILISQGFARQAIVSAATDIKAELLVIATAGLSGLDRMLLGSVTERVLRHTPCPVLVVKTASALNI